MDACPCNPRDPTRSAFGTLLILGHDKSHGQGAPQKMCFFMCFPPVFIMLHLWPVVLAFKQRRNRLIDSMISMDFMKKVHGLRAAQPRYRLKQVHHHEGQ